MFMRLLKKLNSCGKRQHDSSITRTTLAPTKNIPPAPTTIITNSEKDTCLQIQNEARTAIQDEPLITPLLQSTILSTSANNFATVIALIVSSRLFLHSSTASPFTLKFFTTSDTITKIIKDAMESDELEYGYSMAEATRLDLLACKRRDPACLTLLEAVCFYKGFAALVCHRAARRAWGKKVTVSNDGPMTKGKYTRFVSLWLQSQSSAAFGVDIHPCAEIGVGVFFDHGTGVVIGETAKVGHNCTILHDVTLGGTGKESGDRHPKVGNDAMIGAGSKILGNVKIGNRTKIGAGSLVLKSIPNGATAVGVPAKIIGFAEEKRPGSIIDGSLLQVTQIQKIGSEISLHTRNESNGSIQMNISELSLLKRDEYDESTRSLSASYSSGKN